MTGRFAACALASLCLAAVPQPAAGPTAALGVTLPPPGVMYPGHGRRFPVQKMFFSDAVMRDIASGLHAQYVRTGWIPGWEQREVHRPWRREDLVFDAICSAGLRVLVLVPGPLDDPLGINDELASIRGFFARYTRREPGCLRYAEIANEADLPKNGFPDVAAYARYYERVAPIVAAFGVTPITSGTSGIDLRWTKALAAMLDAANSPVGGFGFHPYGIPPSELAGAVREMREAAAAPGGPLPDVYVTEIGQSSPQALYDTIVNLEHATPLVVFYEYKSQPSDDAPQYGLENHPALYRAFRRAALTIGGPASPPAR
jgi:hypothetical protein